MRAPAHTFRRHQPSHRQSASHHSHIAAATAHPKKPTPAIKPPSRNATTPATQSASHQSHISHRHHTSVSSHSHLPWNPALWTLHQPETHLSASHRSHLSRPTTIHDPTKPPSHRSMRAATHAQARNPPTCSPTDLHNPPKREPPLAPKAGFWSHGASANRGIGLGVSRRSHPDREPDLPAPSPAGKPVSV